jgi:hypothetical protein
LLQGVGYEANQLPVKNGTCFTYYIHSNEHVLHTTYIVMYAIRTNAELVPVFQSTGTLVPFGIPAESGRNVPPSIFVSLNWVGLLQVNEVLPGG